MKRKEQMYDAYEAPQVEVIEVEVEQGFYASDPASLPNGGNPF